MPLAWRSQDRWHPKMDPTDALPAGMTQDASRLSANGVWESGFEQPAQNAAEHALQAFG